MRTFTAVIAGTAVGAALHEADLADAVQTALVLTLLLALAAAVLAVEAASGRLQ